MSRSLISDPLQTHSFWLLDAYPVTPLALPMLTPLFGFSSITAPEVQLEMMDITEGNWIFKKKVIKSGDASNIVLERGVTWYDSDFWRWMLAAMTGDLTNSTFNLLASAIKSGGVSPRRTLLLVQFMPRQPVAIPGIASAILQTGLQAAGTRLAGGSGLEVAAAAGTTALLSTAQALIGPFDFIARVPAKAWLLHGAMPIRYKAGGDFNASSAAISIQQLELSIEMVEEIALTA